ncbi:MAG: hypothetical protein Q4G02_01560 [bacterium]|nr:hypothetical protein [bacterium]
MANFNFLKDKKTQQQLLIFAVLIVLGLLIWLVMSIFLAPKSETIDPSLSGLTQTIDPELNLAVLPLIAQKSEFTTTDLSDFPIYLKYTSASDYDSNRLEIIRFEPSVPLDLAYFNLNSASAASNLAEPEVDVADQL